MAKSRKKLDNIPSQQITIYEWMQKLHEMDTESEEGSLNIRERLRKSIKNAIKRCDNQSRYQIAGEMSQLLGVQITKTMMDSWTAKSKESNRIPAEYLPAFCRVCGCNEPLKIMGELVGLFVLPGPEALRAEIQRLDETIKKAQEEKKKRKMFLKEMEGGRAAGK